MRNYLSFLFLLSLVISCTSKNNGEGKQNVKTEEALTNEILEIDPRKFEDNELTLSDFSSEIKYIPLSDKFRMGNTKALKLTQKAIYLVSDPSSGGEGNGQEELFRFDKNGKDPVQIGKIGKGPNEYLTSQFYTVDEPGNRIYISGRLNTVLVFDTLGNYVRQFKFQNKEQRFARFELLGKNRLFVPDSKQGANSLHLWSVVDTVGNIVSSKNNTTRPFGTRLGPRSGTFRFSDKIFYWVDYCDTIFEISPDLTYRASCIITPGEHKLIHQNLLISIDLPEKLLEFYSPHYFMETNKYVISRYNYNRKFAYVFIDKHTRRSKVCYFVWQKDNKNGIPNNLDGGMSFSPEEYFTDGKSEYLAGIIQPFQIKAHIATDEFKNFTALYPEKKKELEQLANSLNENDNPVLMLVKLKE